MLDLVKLSQNPVTLLKINYETEVYTKIPNFILGNAKATVFSMVDDCSQCNNLNALAKSEDLKFLDFQELKEILLTNLTEKKEEIDFCSILIINDIHSLTLEKLILINLWKECYKISTKRPYLIITTFSEYTPELPFQLSKDACQVFGKEKKLDITYHDSNFSPNSKEIEEKLSEIIIQKQSEWEVVGESNWLVFYCGKENLSKHLYRKIGKEANIYTSKSIKKLNRFQSNGKRNIIILEDNYLPPTLMNDIDGVFDSMILKTGDTINYSTKQVSEIRASYQSDGIVFRLCTYEYYKELPKVTQRKYENISLDKYYLEMMKKSLNVDNVFGTIVSKTKRSRDVDNLVRQGAISGEVVTTTGDFIINLPLTTENCCLLSLCYSNKIPVFPCLVACVFSEIRETFSNETEDHTNVFVTYLKKFNKILMQHSELDDVNVTEVAKKENLKSHILKSVLEKIKDVCIDFERKIKSKI